MLSTILIVIGFGSSTALAAAYGIAVTLTMVITAVLLQVVATERWKWPPGVAYAVTGIFLTIDLAFFGANALEDHAWRLAAAGHRRPAVHADDDLEDRTSARRGTPDGAGRADRGAFSADGRDHASGARSRHGGVHDGAAARARRRRSPTIFATTRCCTSTS